MEEVEKQALKEREEHLDWCKKRALEYIDIHNDPKNAVSSMLSDLGKSEHTKGHVGVMLLAAVDQTDKASVRNWIEGFA